MYGARNKLFACSCFTRDEDRRITRCHFGDARENTFQSGRCANDLLKHPGFIHFFARNDVVVLESLFGPPGICDEYSDGSHELPPNLGTVHTYLFFSWIVEPVLSADNPRWSCRVHHIGMGGLPFRLCEE